MSKDALLNWTSACIVGALLCFNCTKEKIIASDPKGKLYVERVIKLMENNYLRRKSIDWQAFRKTIYDKFPNISTEEQAIGPILLAIQNLNDVHSYFRTNRGVYYYSSVGCNNIPSLTITKLDAAIGYIRIPSFVSSSNGASNLFARHIQDTISIQDVGNIGGWIVDLRGNLGGDMWPMLLGIGPILGDGTAGYFVSPDSSLVPFGYQKGTVNLGQYEILNLGSYYQLKNPNPKVAVLIDKSTSSAGEDVAAAFSGRDNTRLFGASRTCGKSTIIETYQLSDGAILGLSVAILANRNRRNFVSGIPPDTLLVDQQKVLSEAVRWLLK